VSTYKAVRFTLPISAAITFLLIVLVIRRPGCDEGDQIAPGP